ncbi:MAG: hypothetical protein RIS70_2137 [Planctomycetota bacterium]
MLRLPTVMLLISISCSAVLAEESTIDFNRDIKPILSNACFKCHGPDAKERKGGVNGLRLDTLEGATADQGGTVAVVPKHPERSELLRRLVTTDADERMPPKGAGRPLADREIELLRKWIEQGAEYSVHWSYRKVIRPPVPTVRDKGWPKNPIDHFIAARLQKEGLRWTEEADRPTLIRRLSLDLTGLPPTPEEVEAFIRDADPQAYEKLVDRLLSKETFGEHWAHLWLDLARYADSAGYADDPPRTIWAFRDYVIRSLNANKPFDRFSVEQIAGDLLPEPTDEQLIATAFHRNTLTNSEGGTDDEEFRNVAVVDRVNTTMAVWMGTTIACAQCHTHKYDPISQEEFFRLFAFYNNTQDADRPDESPLFSMFSAEQLRNKQQWTEEVAGLEQKLKAVTPDLAAAQAEWEKSFPRNVAWQKPQATRFSTSSGMAITRDEQDGSFRVAGGAKTDTYQLDLPLSAGPLAAVRLETLPDDSLPGKGPGYGGGNFVVSRIAATITPPGGTQLAGRYVRVELMGKQVFLHLAEVQAFQGADNIATRGKATQISTDYNGPPELAIDGNTNGAFEAKSVSHTAAADNPWWEVDLGSEQPLDRIVLWNRTDAGTENRLSDYRVALLNEKREVVWEQASKEPVKPSRELALSGARNIEFIAALADYQQAGFEADFLLKPQAGKGWAVGGKPGVAHQVTLIAREPMDVKPGSTLSIAIEQNSPHEQHTIGRFRVEVSGDPQVATIARTPVAIQSLLRIASADRTAEHNTQIANYYLSIAPALQPAREQLAVLRKQLADLKPATTVPVMRERGAKEQRRTRIQHRGNFLDLGDEVTAGTPAVFPALPADAPQNRLGLAQWLISADNPLTPRVMVNRFWEQIFGIGIVATSEEFGSQGELPMHPELLDWLASEFIAQGWNVKAMLRLIVTSAAYRQSSRVTPELMERDPENRLLARGPRFRMSAEMIRDQALAVSGLLSEKMYGPSVKPPQPSLGISAAFGSGIDWATSDGEDRHRRGLYTMWRRSNPYPSMATFDAPNREVCTLRRSRTNTPLQALVTLNDPVYIEAAQALARRIALEPQKLAAANPDSNPGPVTTQQRVAYGFRLCLSREPSENEVARLVNLYEIAKERYRQQSDAAMKMATDPLGPIPEGGDAVDLAAWTVVSNVLLNLDEMLMKR